MKSLRAIVLTPAALFGCGLFGGEPAKTVAEDATCSPMADARFAAALVATCKGKPLSECPEADAIGDTYEEEAVVECSQ